MLLSGSGYIAGLAGLRTLAIVGVTLFHLFPSVVSGGFLGVSFFFVLTGFLLAYTSLHGWNRRGGFSVLSYFGKRIRRIYPLLLLVLVATFGAYHFLLPDTVVASKEELLAIVAGYDNWWQIAQNADYFARMSNTSPFTHLWFLGIELEFYLVWPLLFGLYLLLRHVAGRRFAACVFAGVGALGAAWMTASYQPGVDVTRIYYGTDTRAYAFFFGAAMGFLRAEGKGAGKPSATMDFVLGLIFFAAMLGMLPAYLLVSGQDGATYQYLLHAMTLVFCALLWVTADGGLPFGKWMDAAPLRMIGRHSYAIYLWQYPVIYFCSQPVGKDCPVWTEIGAILLLAIWSDALLARLGKIRLRPQRLRVTSRRSPRYTSAFVVTLLAIPFAVSGIFGGIAIAKAPEHPVSELQQVLSAKAEENARANEQAETSFDEAVQPAENAVAVDDVSQYVLPGGIVGIGDSVMLGSSGALHRVLPNSTIDAEVSRYVGGGLEVAQGFAAQGKLGNIVIVALGTNGPISGADRYEEQTYALLDYLCKDPARTVFWVNVYAPKLTWQDSNNAFLEKVTAVYPSVKIIDWHSLIAEHPEWLTKDGIHPNDDGVAAYAALVHDTISRELMKQAEQTE